MDATTIHILNQLTKDFYARCADSFSATRSNPWNGWKRVIESLSCLGENDPITVLDMGCGNLRFESFLPSHSIAPLEVWAVDNCTKLVSDHDTVHYQELDIISSLRRNTLLDDLEAPHCDISCAFGLFHHVPSAALRARLLESMIDKTKPDGYVAISLWQPEKDERLLEKARIATAKALGLHPSMDLDDHDWLLDWQRQEDVFRYCHSFAEDEADELVRSAEGRAKLIDRFHADGKSDDLNLYLVFRRYAT